MFILIKCLTLIFAAGDLMDVSMNENISDCMNGCPLVSIGIPTFNREKFIGRAIESALCQDYRNLEIIISDNASTDGTMRICQMYSLRDSRIKYYRQIENIGATSNFRDVLKNATGSLFMWLGDDDWLDRLYVSQAVERFRIDPALVLVGGAPQYYTNNISVCSGNRFSLLSDLWWVRVLCYYWNVADNGVFYGLMVTSYIRKIPIMNSMGGDWLVIAGMASLGKVVMQEEMKIYRELGGTSRSYRQIALSCGSPSWIALLPFSATACNAALDIIYFNHIYKNKSLLYRLLVAGAAFFTIICKSVAIRIPGLRKHLRRILSGIMG